ncbi:MAG: oligosaccharide flippase family protein [Myxococcales bacterium]|jgi:O-antigen/teichoic acid export membrane protein
MTDAQAQLKRGLMWLGTGAAIGRLIDIAATISVLFFLTKEEVGTATIAWAIGMALEAVSRLGLGVAILQADEVSRDQLDTVFWTMTLTTLTLGGAAVACGPLVGPLLKQPELGLLLIPSAVKMLFLVWAEVPIQLLNRKLQFASIAGISTGATALGAIARVVMAATGFGPWALLVAQTLYAFFLWIGATLVEPFLPRFRLRLHEIRKFLHFGKWIAGERLTLEAFQNMDYLILGALTGPGLVGIYRVAYDIAMMPAIAIANVVNRTAVPVMSRLRGAELTDLFVSTSGKLAVLMGAVGVVIIASAVDITAIFQSGEYAAAARPTQVLAIAAALRVLFQIFPDMFNAAGISSLTFRFGMVSLIVLAVCLSLALWVIGVENGALALAVGWLGVYPLLIPLAVAASASRLSLDPKSYARSLVAPVSATCFASILGLYSASALSDIVPPWWARVGVVTVLTLLVYAGSLGAMQRLWPRLGGLRATPL